MVICSIIISTLAVVDVLLVLLWLGMSRVLIRVILIWGKEIPGEIKKPISIRTNYRCTAW